MVAVTRKDIGGNILDGISLLLPISLCPYLCNEIQKLECKVAKFRIIIRVPGNIQQSNQN